MKLIHTSDWHLGKSLEGHSRLPEQREFIEEFIETVEAENPDLILVAGDVFDSYNPPAAAEQLYYECMKRLSDGGKRIVAIAAGNHDSPERLSAPAGFMKEHGILVFSYPKQIVQPGALGNHKIAESGEGFVSLEINGETVNLTAVPFPSERRLNEIFANGETEEAMRESYSERVGRLFETGGGLKPEEGWNIAVGHFFTLGGITTDSERPIQIGGGYSVYGDAIPDNLDYIALGHLHRPQRIRDNVIYSGSPIQYSKSEIGYSKAIFAVELKKGEAPAVREIPLRHVKPLEVWKVKGVGAAMKKLEDNYGRSAWVYLDIETDRIIPMEEIREMKAIRPDILAITPVVEGSGLEESVEGLRDENKSLSELFAEFYEQRNGFKPRNELGELLSEILANHGGEAGNETD